MDSIETIDEGCRIWENWEVQINTVVWKDLIEMMTFGQNLERR